MRIDALQNSTNLLVSQSFLSIDYDALFQASEDYFAMASEEMILLHSVGQKKTFTNSVPGGYLIAQRGHLVCLQPQFGQNKITVSTATVQSLDFKKLGVIDLPFEETVFVQIGKKLKFIAQNGTVTLLVTVSDTKIQTKRLGSLN